jgi:hypothetical protein
MRQTTNIKTKAALLLQALACWAAPLAVGADQVYAPGSSLTMKLGGDLHDALPQKFFEQVDAQAIAVQAQDVPLICPVATCSEKRVQRQVQLSAGFIDLANHICHAKAIDKIKPGFFDQYVRELARACATNPAAPPAPIVQPAYWTVDILNDQMSYYNQMMGMMMAINMAHHYLGHYDKYAARLTGVGDKLQPINNFLTPVEWDSSVRAGTLDALNCALSTDGLRVLLDALDKMPTRPAWADFIAPEQTDLKKLNNELAGYEYDFFHGRVK